ncbi:MAG TPA: hypothetical protein VD995_01410 [Azospirillum sp.]|nr:hypothetical protein [Azospirillum sp.]
MKGSEPTLEGGTPAGPGGDPLTDIRLANPGLLRQKYALANWIMLIADDRGLGAAAVARLTGIDPEQAEAILDGVVIATPLPTLDRVLRTLERWQH